MIVKAAVAAPAVPKKSRLVRLFPFCMLDFSFSFINNPPILVNIQNKDEIITVLYKPVSRLNLTNKMNV